MNQVKEAGFVTFRPRARLLKLIGSELISDDVVALTELVKNAYDADATEVVIEFHSVQEPGGSIIVRDNGCGLDLNTLIQNWMEPAGTSKASPDRRTTPRGRRVLGEKGVGRFAVDKLARHLELISRCPGDNEIHATFDWDEFDSDIFMLSDIQTRWEVRTDSAIALGTILRMNGLRTTWNERMFRRLSTRLSRLLSPFQDLDSFTIRIESDEFPQYAGELKMGFLEQALYRIDASFDGRGMVEMAINGDCPRRLAYHQGNLSSGALRIRLFVFDLEVEALSRIGPRAEVRAWLREWSGISIYRDGFRLWPYGEPQDDWLRLDQRRVNNPVMKLSNNQIVGFVEISREQNPELRDQTNREGLINNPAFDDLHQLMYFVLQHLEAERQKRRHPAKAKAKVSQSAAEDPDSIPLALDKLAKRADPDMGANLRRLGQRIRESQAREETRNRQLSSTYAELAALGQSARGFARHSAPLVLQMGNAIDRLQKGLHNGNKGVEDALATMQESIQQFGQQMALLMPVQESGNQRRRAIDLARELKVFADTIRPVLNQPSVSV